MIVAPLQQKKKLYEDTNLTVSEVSSEETDNNQMLRLLHGVDLSEDKLDLWFSNYDDYQMTITNYKHLPRVISVNYENDNQAYALLELEKGQSLANKGTMSLAEVEQLLEAVDHLHRKNFVHGSIKAKNIWITEQGKIVLYGAGEWKAFGLPLSNKEDDLEQLVQIVSRYALFKKEKKMLLQKGNVHSLVELKDVIFLEGTGEKVKGSIVEKNVKGSLVEKPYEEVREQNRQSYKEVREQNKKIHEEVKEQNRKTYEEVKEQNRKTSNMKHKINTINDENKKNKGSNKVNQRNFSLDRSNFAGFWKRTFAYLIDYLILYVPLRILFGDTGVALNLLFSWIYFAAMESSNMQATLGKKIFGIIVINKDGQRITFRRAVGRYFAKWISSFTLGIGYFMVAFTKRKQGLHDKIASTFIIHAKN